MRIHQIHRHSTKGSYHFVFLLRCVSSYPALKTNEIKPETLRCVTNCQALSRWTKLTFITYLLSVFSRHIFAMNSCTIHVLIYLATIIVAKVYILIAYNPPSSPQCQHCKVVEEYSICQIIQIDEHYASDIQVNSYCADWKVGYILVYDL